MAADVEVIIAKFQADISDYQAKLNQLEKEVRELSATEKKGADEHKKSSAELVTASQKRKAAIVAEQAELKKLQTGIKSAFTVPEIEKFNAAITKTKNNIATLKGETAGVGNITGGLKTQFAALGAGIAAAFSVQAVIAFGKASIDAFLEAEENATRLKNSLREVGEDGEKAFSRLIKQSEKLAQTGVTIFTDDDIQRAQAQLATFGLTADEIEKIIPKLADYASATKQNIVDASAKVGQALIGQGREFKKYGINVDATKTSQENFNIVLEGFSQFQGRAAKETQTLTGQLADQKREVEELQESVGEKLAPAFVAVRRAFLGFINSILDTFSVRNKLITDFKRIGIAAEETDRILAATGGRIDQSKEGQKAAKSYQSLIVAIDYFNNALKDSKQPQIDYQKSLSQLNFLITQQNTQTFEGQTGIRLLKSGIIELTETYNNLNPALKSSIDLSKKYDDELLKLKESSGDDRDLLILIEREISARKKADEAVKKSIELQKKLADEKKKAADAEEVELNRLAGVNKDFNAQIQDEATKKVADNAKILNEQNKGIIKDRQNLVLADSEFEISETQRKEDEKTKILKEAEEERALQREAYQKLAFDSANKLFDTIFSIQKSNLERSQEAESEALKEEKDKALSNKRLTEAEKEQINKEYAAKEHALKKKQFEDNKNLALAEAIIKGALAVVEALASSAGYPYNLILAATAAAATAAEIATITATKYAKGTKAAKGGMALVGEEGPEYMYVPNNAMIMTAGRTRQHRDLVAAMMDNNIDQYLEQNYLLPRLNKMKFEFENKKEKSFSNNLVKSLMFHGGITGNEMERIRKRGTDINNVDELAQKIAEILIVKSNPRRRV